MRIATALVAVLMSAFAIGQATQPATQPATPESLAELFRPYEHRIMARVAELPAVPTDAQIDACKMDCDAIGDEFEQFIRFKYVSYSGFVNSDRTAYQWYDRIYQLSPRERAAGKKFASGRPTPWIITYSKPITGQAGFAATCEGQVLQCTVELFIGRDSMGNAPATASTVAAYPMVRAYLNEGNVVPQDFQSP